MRQLAGCACGEEELDKSALLDDGRIMDRPGKSDAFFRANHGEEYAMSINNQRCSRPG